MGMIGLEIPLGMITLAHVSVRGNRQKGIYSFLVTNMACINFACLLKQENPTRSIFCRIQEYVDQIDK